MFKKNVIYVISGTKKGVSLLKAIPEYTVNKLR